MRFHILMLAALVVLSFGACDGDDAPASLPTRPPGATAVFTHGVASGEVRADSAVLWTRADGGDDLTVELAKDETFAEIVLTASASTSAASDYTARVRVGGLEPDTRYHYRFRAGGSVSPSGRFGTAPLPSISKALRFVFSGDSDGSRNAGGSPVYNEFEVLGAAAAENADFFLYFGDTIYGDRDPTANSLDEYRAKYRQNREYRALADILGREPIYTTWDDHEVYNDFAGETVDGARFEAGRQAYQEYMPLLPEDQRMMYNSFRQGAELEIIVLDTRSFRSASAADACAVDGNPDPLPAGAAPGAPDSLRGIRAVAQLAAELRAACFETIDDPARTMLGEEQKQYLLDRLASSDATWKVVVNSVPMQPLLFLPYDRWEGYAAERREILEFIREESIANVVFLTTDFHANIFGPVRVDPFVDTEPIAYEAIAGPIATAPLRRDVVDVVGEGAAELLGTFMTSIIGVDCAQLDSYAYALVEIDPDAGTMTITAKDGEGSVLCRKVLEAA